MARIQKMTDREISNVLDTFVRDSRDKYDGYAFPVGYIQSVLTQILADLPVAKQQQIVRRFIDWQSN